MHVPDGIVPLWLLAILFGVSILFLGASVKIVNRKFDERVVPYMGVLAAVIFAAQLVNYPIPPSSGHLVGSTLLAIMVGPWAGMLIIGMVLLGGFMDEEQITVFLYTITLFIILM